MKTRRALIGNQLNLCLMPNVNVTYITILIKLKHYWYTTFPPLYVFFFWSLEHRTSEDRLKSVGGRSNGTVHFFEEITFCSDSFSPLSCPWFCMGVCSDSLPCVGGSPGYIRVSESTTVILWFSNFSDYQLLLKMEEYCEYWQVSSTVVKCLDPRSWSRRLKSPAKSW